MAVMSEFKKERENLKNAPFKVKFQYFLDYYKWYVIIPAVIIIFVSNYIYHAITDPETILNGVLLNCSYLETVDHTTDIIQGLYDEYKIDTKEEEITFNTTLNYSTTDSSNNYTAMQALMAWSGAGALDFMCADFDTMTEFAYKGYFTDLRNVLSEDELALYEPYFLYMDQGVINQINEAYDNMDNSYTPVYPDCTKPEEMEEPIPIMIDVSASQLAEVYGDSTDVLAYGIVTKSEHQDMVLKMLDYILFS